MSYDKRTMCELAEEKDIAEMKARTKGACWFCNECGRSAKMKEHICEPAEL